MSYPVAGLNISWIIFLISWITFLFISLGGNQLIVFHSTVAGKKQYKLYKALDSDSTLLLGEGKETKCHYLVILT